MMVPCALQRPGWYCTLAMLLLVLTGCGEAVGTAMSTAATTAEAAPGEQPANSAKREPPAPPGDGQDVAPEEDPTWGASPNEKLMTEEDPFAGAEPAPALTGGVEWLNTSGPLEIKHFRGKFVLLDFWTYCCINCMHILPELKKLERAYPTQIVVIGVHSAKFDGEKDSQNIREAILRHDIEHPVVNDAHQIIWQKYGLEGWPGLRVIDPQGRLVAGHGGEITFEALDAFFKKFLPYYKAKGLLDETPLRFDLERDKAAATPLRFPGKLLADAAGNRLFITDSSHNRIVIARLDGALLDVIGDGQPGLKDGPYEAARFDHPQGLALRGQTLYVADTENHVLRKIDLERRTVTTIAGLGRQARMEWPGITDGALALLAPVERFYGKPLKTALNSPWDLWIHENDLYIAMAGPHQIWRMPLDESEIGVYAGNGREDIVDGPTAPTRPFERGTSSFAQPSGLASDGKWLYVADSEGSSIRAVPLDPSQEVRTIVGTAHLRFGRLFTFGDVDGKAPDARLQHCLGVAYHEGKLYVADTYNNKIKVLDLAEEKIESLVGQTKAGKTDQPPRFDEPSGLSIADGKVYVADTNNHAIRAIDLATRAVSTLAIKGLEPPAPARSEQPVDLSQALQLVAEGGAVKPANGAVHLEVELALPPGWKLNPMAPLSYAVLPGSDGSVVERATVGKWVRLASPRTKFKLSVPVRAVAGSETLRVGVNFYYCQEDGKGLCKAGSVAWTVPVRLSADGAAALSLRHEVQ